jgi:hypothetical protein
MFALKPRAVRPIVGATLAVLTLGMANLTAAAEKVQIKQIGNLDSIIASRILTQVTVVPLDSLLRRGVPILLQGKTLKGMPQFLKDQVKASYLMGRTIVLLDATMSHVSALHALVGEGVTYRSKNSGTVMFYALRRENQIPTATLFTHVPFSPLLTASGARDPYDVHEDPQALDRAADRAVAELSRLPNPRAARPRAGQEVQWADNPLQSQTFALNNASGVYNTVVNVFALHSCETNLDHYVVTAEADWTPTNAKWQSATTYTSPPSMYLDGNLNLVINWQDGRGQNDSNCSSPPAADPDANICRYINYPASYSLQMVPRGTGSIVQIAAAPSATQGQATTFQSGFTFNVGGSVNVSSQGPGGGLSAGASWTNTVVTTVPPLIVEVSNTGNEGVDWRFRYCTTGLESDSPDGCTGHVQMVRNVCQAQLGDPSSRTNPQQGQTPVGKFSNAVQSAHWQASPDTRVGASTFDIEVTFTANLATTTAHLEEGGNYGGGSGDIDPNAGCNFASCGCVSVTNYTPASQSFTFHIPFPSTVCK